MSLSQYDEKEGGRGKPVILNTGDLKIEFILHIK
jgi:hypothetical protein